MGLSHLGKRRRAMDDDAVDDVNLEDHSIGPPQNGVVHKTIVLHLGIFKDNSLSMGGYVKANGQVIREYSAAIRRPPNMNCLVESFGRICQKFDERRARWVCEMGFGGLLHFASHMHLPRQLAYWIMTCIDLISRTLCGTNGRSFKLSKNQVHWILGIPSGFKPVPINKQMSGEVRVKVQDVIMKYGRTWETKPKEEYGRTYTSLGILVTTKMMDRLEGHFDAHEEEEFKILFLIVALQMILCPTQSPRLASDLLLAVGCVMDCTSYDWCELVLSKFIDSVSTSARRFYANGYAGGCGGCAIFGVILYLDRLNLDPNDWDIFPRVNAWSMKRISIAGKLDRTTSGDYGKLGLIDVAYGERHPRVARDTFGPPDFPTYDDVSELLVANTKDSRKRADLCDGYTNRTQSASTSHEDELSYKSDGLFQN